MLATIHVCPPGAGLGPVSPFGLGPSLCVSLDVRPTVQMRADLSSSAIASFDESGENFNA
jgi:hypothetical protein